MNADGVIINTSYVLREEYDDWAILFNPDTSESYGLNPVSVYIYKRLCENIDIPEIVSALQKKCTGVPENACILVHEFVDHLIANGIAGRGKV